MPDGIGVELIIAGLLVVLIATVVLLARGGLEGETVRRRTRRKFHTWRSHRTAERTRRRRPEAPEAKPEAPPRPIPEEHVPAKPTLADRLTKSRRLFTDRLAELLGRGVGDETWDDLEALLIQADIGVDAATEIVADLKDRAREVRATDSESIRGLLAERLVGMFDSEADRSLRFSPDGVTVWMMLGVNGTGKTTTIGKLANDLTERGNSVALAAADTFRAAADEQLGIWAARSGAGIVKHQPGADPGAVAFDAWQHAQAKGTEVLIVDTAGRLHTKTPLMDELAKIRRVLEKEGRVDEALLVIDATSGQNGLVQAREFAESADVTGIVLTKLDGTAKGGIAVAIESQLGIPIKLIGVGEDIDDLEPFNPKTFVDALLA